MTTQNIQALNRMMNIFAKDPGAVLRSCTKQKEVGRIWTEMQHCR